MARRVMREPFGLPVVPEVYRMTAVSCGDTGTGPNGWNGSEAQSMSVDSVREEARSFVSGVTRTALAEESEIMNPMRSSG